MLEGKMKGCPSGATASLLCREANEGLEAQSALNYCQRADSVRIALIIAFTASRGTQSSKGSSRQVSVRDREQLAFCTCWFYCC